VSLIRPALPADLDAIGAVHQQARQVAYAGIVPAAALEAMTARKLRNWWARRFAAEAADHRMAVLDRGGVVVGFSYVGPATSGNGVSGAGELYALHVHPDHQGRGLGRALIRHAVGTLADLGYRDAVLWVLAGNASARRFYARAGWTEDGATRTGPIGDVDVPQVRYVRPIGATTPISAAAASSGSASSGSAGGS
jgi:ribosomal protein S18 acetylase RimI-like enzyme